MEAVLNHLSTYSNQAKKQCILAKKRGTKRERVIEEVLVEFRFRFVNAKAFPCLHETTYITCKYIGDAILLLHDKIL